MSLEEFNKKNQKLIKELEDLGFKRGTTSVLQCYDIDISRYAPMYRKMSVAPMLNNQFIYIREGDINEPRHKDDVVCLFNSDMDGELTIEHVKALYELLKFKNKK